MTRPTGPTCPRWSGGRVTLSRRRSKGSRRAGKVRPDQAPHLSRRGRRPRAGQVDDGKPVKARRPPGARARLAAELVRAAETGDLNRVKARLAAGVPPDARNKNGVSALYAGAAEGRADVV